MTVDVSPLFRSFSLGSLRLPNRVVMAPMTRNRSPEGVPGADVAAYYARRARGGVGLIIAEAAVIEHVASSGYPGVPAFFGAGALAGWRKVVEAVHAEGSCIFPQLWHVGAIRRPGLPPNPEITGYSPSGIAKPGGKVVGHAMTDSDIADVIAAFARAAVSAKELGCDGIELHGAHGYLIDQFFWGGLNVRSDGYGGSPEARSRFAVEAISAVRKAVGPAFPLAFRFSQWKQQDYTVRLAHSPEELSRFLRPLVDAGVDIFDCSTRRFYQPEFEGSPLNLAGWTKELTGKPSISVGSVGLDTDFVRDEHGGPFDLGALCERLARDEFALIAIGRALIGDADWANKVRSGRTQDIRPFSKLQLAELS